MTQAEVHSFIRRVQADLYFGPDNLRVVIARIDERLRNTATKEDIASLKISMTRWFLGSSLTLVGLVVTVFKWLLP